MRVHDLSHPFFTGMYKIEKYPELEVQMEPVRLVEKDGINILKISFGNHIGTHLDGPKHVVPGGAALDDLPLETFYGTGVIVDVPKGRNGGVTVADLEAASPAIQERDIVLLHTGWGDKMSTPEYPEYHPYLTEEAAHWLADRRVRMVGIDCSSLDLPHSLRPPGFRHGALRILLERNIPAIHNITNMGPIANQRVLIFALPINFTGADGAPARVFALLD